MALAKSRFSDQSGFSLAEVLVAIVILVTGVIALAQLFIISTSANRVARVTTLAMVLAGQKMEQLRGLTWGFDVLGLPLSDTTSDISTVPVTSSGAGLSPSPAGSLAQNMAGYVDYLDENGQWVGSGAQVPRGTVYIRRWSIEPLPTNPNNTLILQVLVTRLLNRGNAGHGSVARLPEEARLVSVKTRKSL
jgi:prepilin-type N-terminal cleavage/methylation domain-containing protein